MALSSSTSARNAMPPVTLHPFFTKGQKPVADVKQTTLAPDHNGDQLDEKENIPAGSSLPTPPIIPRTDLPSKVELHSDVCLEEDPNASRRKRRKSSDPEETGAQTAAATANGSNPINSPRGVEQVQVLAVPETNLQAVQVLIPVTDNSSSLPGDAGLSKSNTIRQGGEHGSKILGLLTIEGPVLSLSKTGTLVTAKMSKSDAEPIQRPPAEQKTGARRVVSRRGPKSRKDAETVELRKVLALRYQNADTGVWIDDILSGRRRYTSPKSTTNITESAPTKATKPTHPFFARPADVKTRLHNPPPTENTEDQAANLISGRAATRQQTAAPAMFGGLSSTLPQSVSKNATGKEAPWPWKGTSSVTYSYVSPFNAVTADTLPKMVCKTTNDNTASTLASASVLKQTAARLRRSLDTSLSSDDSFLPVLPTVRLPKRFEQPGSSIQRFLLERLAEPHSHAATRHLASNVLSSLPPFDLGGCESLAWTQKYSPATAQDVLQSGSEVAVLKDWLSSHCIHNVDAGNGQKKKPPKMKKKRRRADLDDFIVDSSDEDEEFGSFTDVDGDIPSPRPIQERSRVRKQPRSSTPAKNANVLVISGPHGCGKTAAVYAVARELDFEVFEINSGSRRSGKDILDKIGDMAENHLVQRISKAASTEDTIDSADDIVETVEDRGRQGNMTSFFKPVATKKTSKPKSTDDQATKVANSESRRQKQSLILFEEVDILFEDDKQFWPTVIALAVHCKRPIILTCTDETRVPMESLILHAVLRLTPPPTSMAADYLLAMAACEGHILDLQAVQGLYVTKQRDLRACIAELNFRCRMSIGSRRGGLDWMVARWPPGCDLDANGEKLRVVSEGTYQAGMEWENRDFAAEERAEELAFGESLAWGLPLDELAFSSDFRASVNDGSSVIDTLEAVCDARSSADVFCRAGLRNDFTALLDPTHPEPTDKQRRDRIEGLRYVSAQPASEFCSLSIPMASSILALTNRILHQSYRPYEVLLRHHSDPEPDPQPASRLLSPLAALATADPVGGTGGYYSLGLVTSSPSSSSTAPTALHREPRVQLLDVAPYARAIARHDLAREAERARSYLLSTQGSGSGSDGGPKRVRLTRASRSAVEGGRREETRVRRDRWWDKDVNLKDLLRTGGEAWGALADGERESLADGDAMEI